MGIITHGPVVFVGHFAKNTDIIPTGEKKKLLGEVDITPALLLH